MIGHSNRVYRAMQLSLLRHLMQQHNNNNLFQFISREPVEIKLLKIYVKAFKDGPEDYQLTHADIFDLVKLLPPDSEHLLVLAIEGALGENHIFKILHKTPEEKDKKKALAILYQHGLLNDNTVKCVAEEPVFSKVVILLSNKSLLVENNDLLLRQKNIEEIWITIDYLNKANLLRTELITSCLLAAVNQPLLISFLEYLAGIRLFLREDRLNRLLQLTENKINRLYNILENYIINKTGLLTQDIFDKILQRITQKIPGVKESTFVEVSPSTKHKRGEILVDDKDRFFIARGYFLKYNVEKNSSDIRKAYSIKNSTTPDYVLKEIRNAYPVAPEKQAKKEAKINALLGRKAFYSGNTLITAWHAGICVTLTSPQALQNALLKTRLICIADGIKDLETLHVNDMVHGDIKPDNFILDLQNQMMKLIDFGGIHRNGSEKKFGFTPKYMEGNDPREYLPNQCGYDMRALGITIKFAFPELYEIREIDGIVYSILLKKMWELTPQERAIVTLVDSTEHSERERRCTTEDALLFCQQVLEKFDQLKYFELAEIIDETLNRPSTLEHAIRGRVRPR